MESLILEKTEDTPEINFEPDKNNFSITGRSLPENAMEFYSPVLNWLKKYLDAKPHKQIPFVFKLEYFNTASSKQIIKILLLIEQYKSKINPSIKWYYNKIDEDMKSVGLRYQKLLSLDFEFIEH